MNKEPFKAELEDLPFIAWLPDSTPIADLTRRRADQRWDTLRFFVEGHGSKIRVKEFFLDWFFPGFPKSLMSSLFGTYSNLEAVNTGRKVLFLGRNYKGNPAASTYLDGTTVEMELIEGNSSEDLLKLFGDLRPYDRENRICAERFHERSFFARGKKGTWFEDDRISRLQWMPPQKVIEFSGYRLSSVGKFTMEGNVVQEIFVFERDCFRRGFWIEIVREDADIPYAYYAMREEPGIMDRFYSEDYFLSWRHPDGPFLGQIKAGNGLVITVGGSPFVLMNDVRKILSDPDRILRLTH